ncbi:MAG: 50S ribosomal protein L25/general stress protein Ctc [Myxococcota bacterium]
MGEFELEAEPREATGKGPARKLRVAGRIPGTCYRHGGTSVSVSVEARTLGDLLKSSAAGLNTLIDLKVAGGGEFDGVQVIVKELQIDPVSRDLVHADFFAVDLTETIHVSVPVHLVGSAFGVTMGGIVDHALRTLEIQCLPNAIPEEFQVDVSALDVGDAIHVRDMILPASIELLTDRDLPVVSVVAPAVVEEEVVEEEVDEDAVAEEGEAGEQAPEPTEEPSAD